MHNQKSILENGMHKIFGNFEIQMKQLISTRWSDQVIVNKKKKKKREPAK